MKIKETLATILLALQLNSCTGKEEIYHNLPQAKGYDVHVVRGGEETYLRIGLQEPSGFFEGYLFASKLNDDSSGISEISLFGGDSVVHSLANAKTLLDIYKAVNVHVADTSFDYGCWRITRRDINKDGIPDIDMAVTNIYDRSLGKNIERVDIFLKHGFEKNVLFQMADSNGIYYPMRMVVDTSSLTYKHYTARNNLR